MRILRATILAAVIAFVLSACATVTPPAPIVAAVNEGNATLAASLVSTSSSSQIVFALNRAAQLGKLGVVQALVERGADINGGAQLEPTKRVVTGYGGVATWIINSSVLKAHSSPNTPIAMAAASGNFEVVKWLVEHGAKIDLQGFVYVSEDLHREGGASSFRIFEVNQGTNALAEAVRAKNSVMVQYLIDHGANVNRSIVISSASLAGIAAFGLCGATDQLSDCIRVRGVNGIVPISRSDLFFTPDGYVHTTLPLVAALSVPIRKIMDVAAGNH